jgi:hypothetical protein
MDDRKLKKIHLAVFDLPVFDLPVFAAIAAASAKGLVPAAFLENAGPCELLRLGTLGGYTGVYQDAG